VSGYELDDRAIKVRSPAETRDFFLWPLWSDRLWGPSSLLYSGYRMYFPGGKVRPGCDTDHSPHQVPRSWMSRSYTPSLPLLLRSSMDVLWDCFTFFTKRTIERLWYGDEWWWIEKAFVGSGRGLILRFYADIFLEGLTKATNTEIRIAGRRSRDLNPRTREYGWVLTTRPQCSVTHNGNVVFGSQNVNGFWLNFVLVSIH
jgi:hypothetical protein